MYREDLFEGDIVLTNNGDTVFNPIEPMNRQDVGDKSQDKSSIPQVEMIAVQLHNAVRQKTLLWPKGRVPYFISAAYPNISKLIILEAFKEFHLTTCIQFIPKRQFDYNYIYIAPYDGCYSMVGNNGGRQIVSLGDGCLKKGIVIHELMHVIGFFHEQNRPDRDLYVNILWENVKPSLIEQFDKYSPTIIDNLGSPYDYDSVTHYAAGAFSKNNRPTIIPKSSIIRIGQRRGLSPTDIWKVNKLYNCPRRTITTSTSYASNLKLSSTIRRQFSTTPTTVTVSSIPSTAHNTTEITTANNNKGFEINSKFSTISTLPLSFTTAYMNGTTIAASTSAPF
ncbi:Astacin (Peptidase M12A) family protein [Acanthocheilonema viteae]